jgi:transglutaminase-like putative cysteine protease
MRLDFAHRFASYLTLALSCACLIHAEAMYVPGIAWFQLPVLLLIAVAYRLEGRWALSDRTGSTLAALICAGLLTMFIIQIGQDTDTFAALAPLPMLLVPYAGPVLVVLLLIKLFKWRRPSDAWQLQTIGLLQAALACLLGGDPLFGLLLCAYLLSALWWLMLFSLHRQHARDSAPLRPLLVPWRWGGVPRVGRWLALALASGVLLALVTPRIGSSQWDPLMMLGKARANVRAETGLPALIDLNRTGQVEVNDEIVIELRAESSNGAAKLDMAGDQRFRGMYLDYYEDGCWRGHRGGIGQRPSGMIPPGPPIPGVGDIRLGMPEADHTRSRENKELPSEYFGASGESRMPRAPRVPGPLLPDLGPSQYVLSFTLKPRKAGGLFLAEPVLLLPEHQFLPVTYVDTVLMPGPLFVEMNGSIVHVSPPPRGTVQYRQAMRDVPNSDLSPPVEVTRNYQLDLCAQPPESLRQWVDDLVRRLAERRAYGLQTEDLAFGKQDERRVMLPARREKAARALCDYLRTSGEYTYTLDLRRHDPDLDPTEDFLRNVKQGHCERYAGALALMLRTVGVPARVVKGYRGCQSAGDGTYWVRNSDAHTWVEALVARSEDGGPPHLHWLSLDPTPLDEAPAAAAFSWSQWWFHCSNRTGEIWRLFVAEYGAEEQTALAEELWGVVASRRPGSPPSLPTGAIAGLAVGVPLFSATLLAIMLLRKWRRHSSPSVVRVHWVRFYARLLDLLVLHFQLRPAPAQTPQEFGARAAQTLTQRPATAPLADLPQQVVALFYRVRYGGETLAAGERRVIEDRLDEFAARMADG